MLRSCAPATCQPFVKMAGMFRPMATLRPAVAKVAQPVAKTQTRNMGGGAHHDPYDVRLPPSPHSQRLLLLAPRCVRLHPFGWSEARSRMQWQGAAVPRRGLIAAAAEIKCVCVLGGVVLARAPHRQPTQPNHSSEDRGAKGQPSQSTPLPCRFPSAGPRRNPRSRSARSLHGPPPPCSSCAAGGSFAFASGCPFSETERFAATAVGSRRAHVRLPAQADQLDCGAAKHSIAHDTARAMHTAHCAHIAQRNARWQPAWNYSALCFSKLLPFCRAVVRRHLGLLWPRLLHSVLRRGLRPAQVRYPGLVDSPPALVPRQDGEVADEADGMEERWRRWRWNGRKEWDGWGFLAWRDASVLRELPTPKHRGCAGCSKVNQTGIGLAINTQKQKKHRGGPSLLLACAAVDGGRR